MALRTEVLPFSPDLGPLEHRLHQLARGLTGSEDDAARIDRQADDVSAEIVDPGRSTVRKLRWALTLSILADILAAGGKVYKVDSSLHVAWPKWSSPEGQKGIRRGLLRLRDEARLGPIEPKVLALLPSRMAPEELETLAGTGDIALMDAFTEHPSGPRYHDIFVAARRSWTMPLRDREGRNRRFVLTVRHPRGGDPIPAGILEAGDGSPMSPARDQLVGLTPKSLSAWVNSSSAPGERLEALELRFSSFLKAVLPIPDFRRRGHNELYSAISEIETSASGRSVSGSGLAEKKRLSYVARLTRAIEAVRVWRTGLEPDPSNLYAATRVVRDLVIPRINLELTVCGALPPFSAALFGKLLIAFSADPRVLEICRSKPGAILGSVFDVGKLSRLLPNSGALILTTKGLYAHHSAQYTRAELPSAESVRGVPLRKIGVTSGITASLMSKRTYDLAKRILGVSGTSRTVSEVFGSGGSKRQRRIEAAVQELGLPEAVIHPHIQRPIYAAALASNSREVCLLNEEPRWLVVRGTPTEYGKRAVDLWRETWLETSRRRLRRYSQKSIGGLRELLSTEKD